MDCRKAFNIFIDAVGLSGYHVIRIEDINYADENIEFKIQELPKWRFGIWWSDRPEYNNYYFSGVLFCQYSETCCKFKPSHSPYYTEISLENEDSSNSNGIIEVISILDFITKHPLRAWYRDYHWIDYNINYISPLTILIKNIMYKLSKFNERFLGPILDKHMCKLAIELWTEDIYDEAIHLGWKLDIYDSGKDIYPRYEIRIEMPEVDRQTQDIGIYGLSGELQHKWDNKSNFCRKPSKFFGFWWSPAISDSAMFWSKNIRRDINE